MAMRLEENPLCRLPRSYVSCEIKRLTPFFNDFRQLADPEWHFDNAEENNHGDAVKEFLEKTGRFYGIKYNCNKQKRLFSKACG